VTRMTPDKADQKLELLDKALKDANLVLADFKTTIREGRALLADIKKVVEDRCEEVVGDAVADSIAKLGTATEAAIEASEKGIYDRFDQLHAILMGEDKKGKKRRGDEESIPELIKKLPYCTVHEERHGPGAVRPNCVFQEGGN
jgi:hypothetical protein